MPPIRLLLVDDHRIIREGLQSMLRTQADMEVVGEAGDGAAAVSAATRFQPDVILLDLEMPGLDGIAVLTQLREHLPQTRTIVLTAYGTDDRILEAVRHGAKGYLLKGASLAEVLHAIRTVAAGGSLLEPGITDRLLDSVGRMLRHDALPEPLSERELSIVRLMARGYANKAIGEELHLAERTVKFYVTIIFQKLGVANRAEAVATALREHLIEL